jgi:MFS family permease
MPLKEKTHYPRFFYGWYVLASSFVMLFFNSGARFSIGVTFKPMIAAFGWNRGAVSLAFFLNMIFFALSLSVIGRFYDRYGPKWVIVISTVFISTGYMAMSVMNSYWQFLAFYGILSAIGLGGTAVPLISALMSKWFEKRRGLAISLALSGSCLGQFALVPLLTILVLRYGWRVSYLCVGIVMFVVNIILALGVIRGDPEDLGHRPFGYEDGDKSKEQGANGSSGDRVRDLGLTDAMRTYSFWFLLVALFICGSGDFMITTHLIPFVTDYGISPTRAGNMLAWFGLMSLIGILIAGPVSDLIGCKIPISITFLLRLSLFVLVLMYQTPFVLYIFALAFGLSFLVSAPLTPPLLGRLYGFSHIGLLNGFITTVHTLGGGFWAYMGGVIFDKTGSYRLTFILSAIMALIAFTSTILIKEKRHQSLFQTRFQTCKRNIS